MHEYEDDEISVQIAQSLALLQEVFQQHLLGVYLFGSSVVGGLQKFSDLDLFVVVAKPTTPEQKKILVTNLLQISGVYQLSSKPPIELTIVVATEINPWDYPPKFDFQYGDWLREAFAAGNLEPWPTKIMPDLAVMITQLLLSNLVLFGPQADKLLCAVPYNHFLAATKDTLKHLTNDLMSDTRNVLLTCARIWCSVETDTICSKPDAATWALSRLPDEYKLVIQRARAICVGEQSESWLDLNTLLQPTLDYMIVQINQKIAAIETASAPHKRIMLADDKSS